MLKLEVVVGLEGALAVSGRSGRISVFAKQNPYHRKDLLEGVASLVLPDVSEPLPDLVHGPLLGARTAGTLTGVGSQSGESLRALDKLYAVPVWVADEEDPGSAAHGVWLALEVHAAGLLELLGQGVEVFDGEGDVAVALA